MTTPWERTVLALGLAAACVGMTAALLLAQEAGPDRGIEIPAGTRMLEGIPTVRVDSAEDGATRRVLSAAEAARDRLTVSVVDGRLYWTSRDNRLLRLGSSDGFTYLSSSDPGRYIRLTRINDRIAYVEHVELATGSVTWWGELRIVVGR